MSLKRVTIGRIIFEGDSDQELFTQYLLSTVTSMADMDGVFLPYEFLDKLAHLIESMPADEFEGCLDDAQADM